MRSEFNPSAKESTSASYPHLPRFESGAVIGEVCPSSAADRQGIRPGMMLISVDGIPIDDILDWYWLSDGIELDAVFEDSESGRFDMHLTRSADESWGISFSDNVFDGVRTCCNTCIFCFMSMLPKGMRPSLYLRDDDYRLSFLQGNFVTLTNVSDEELERIIAMELSPLHVSLHAIDARAREELMGPNHQRGLDVAEALVEAGIEFHAQIVLCPGINDGEVLGETLQWVLDRPEVLSIGIVPVGYTGFQQRFDSSYELPERAIRVIEQVEGFQRESIERYGYCKIQLADEFYVNAFPDDIVGHLPSADAYDGYSQFYDGLGMLRSFVDDWNALVDGLDERKLDQVRTHWVFIAGQAFKCFFDQMLADGPFEGRCTVIGVDNRFFGGNVDVNGLLTGNDVIEALQSLDLSELGLAPEACSIALPAVMFNDEWLTLDDIASADIERVVPMPIRVLPYFANDMFELLIST
ncbi:MAG: DUF512 domain-containing protein [bacterium]|nr:DUF512 domain-containing protein [bacterium]